MIKIGIAGYGKIGKLRANILSERKDVKIVGIYDVVKPERTENITFYNSYDDLLNAELDAVFICAYNTVLADYTAKALNKGVHVFCEKPPAMKTEELGIVFEALKSSKKKIKIWF
jgi:predicted dehydrogenase